MAMTRRRLLALVLTATIALGAIVALAIASRDEPAPSGRGFEGSLMPAGVRAPDFRDLTDQDGRSISWSRFRGEAVIVTFLYSHCEETCPVEAKIVTQARQRLGGRVPALAISVDPRHDTPASARAFNAKQDVDVTWVLGPEKEIQKLWRGYAIQPQTTEVEHQARVVLVDRQGLQRVGFPYGQLTPDRIAHDIRLLQRL
ncbi:MAG: SCO family protein [Thermoleophilaceae bacterium]|nr:SCO family protein [Thermoleophilaceae bacterium]